MTVYTAQYNFTTKAAFRAAVEQGHKIRLEQAGLGPSLSGYTGEIVVTGPKYPEPHTWYAQVEVVNGYVTKVT